MLLPLLIGACHPGPKADPPAEPRQAAVFIAKDYAFEGPDRIPAGLVSLQVVNRGTDLHHVQLVRLKDGRSAQDFAQAVKAEPSRLPAWAEFFGGPNAVEPGQSTEALLRLAPGSYVITCIIPDRKGVPHVALGMHRPVAVAVVHPQEGGREPSADLVIDQVDFGFSLPKPMTAGRHTVRVVNKGTQVHEVVVVRLAPGATLPQFLAALGPGASGPPPGHLLGGITGLEPQGTGFITEDWTPGRYGFLCFFPDPATGQPHFARGMQLQFDVADH